MKRIAIVEDEDRAAEQLISYIARYEGESGQRFDVQRFSSADEFLSGYSPVYAVVFMDIQMPGTNGMDAAVRLRALDRTISVLFITSLVQFAQKGYEVDAVGFLVKPVAYYDFLLKFRKALDLYVMNEERSISLALPGGMCRLSTDRLMYVEIISHRLYYHLVDDVVEMTGALSGAERQLAPYGFLRCNNCYLVNPRFVVKVKGQEVQVGNATLQISRPKRAAFLEGLAAWFAGKGGTP